MQELNRRWAHGRPSKELAHAGVLARLFDPSEDPNEPWRPCRGPHVPSWCRVYGDRMPASLINAHTPSLYSKGDSHLAGLIVNPFLASVLCSYSSDGSTMNKMCDPPGVTEACVPGCPTGHLDAEWCRRRDDETGSLCGWQPTQTDQMLMQQSERGQVSAPYNELVLDAGAWEDALPQTVSAVFYPVFAREDQKQRARAVHLGFLRRYALTRYTLPLLEYDPEGGDAFVEVPNG